MYVDETEPLHEVSPVVASIINGDFVDAIPGETVDFRVTLSLPPQDASAVVYESADIELGPFASVSLEDSITLDSTETTFQVDLSYAIEPELQAICEGENDEVTYIVRVELHPVGGGASETISSEWAVQPCTFLTEVTPDVDLFVQVENCGPDNDTGTFEQEGVAFAMGDWSENSNIITFTPADGYYFPEGTVDTHPVTDQVTDCIISGELVPPVVTATCDGNNDEITASAGQPEGVNSEPVISEWTDGEATVSYSALDGYAFSPGARTSFTLTDDDIPCDEEPAGIEVTVLLNTSDGGAIEGATYQLFAPVASQVAPAPYAEGQVGPNNQIVFSNLIVGEYRLTVEAEGYEPVNEILAVTDGTDTQEISIAVAQVVGEETPTPELTQSPTATASPTPTESPTATSTPSSTAAAVTALPETGVGSGVSQVTILLAAAAAAAMVLTAIGSRKFR